MIYAEDRDELMRHLKANDVGCEIYYPPPSPLSRSAFPYCSATSAAISRWHERAAAMSLALTPSTPTSAPDMIERVVEVIADFRA